MFTFLKKKRQTKQNPDEINSTIQGIKTRKTKPRKRKIKLINVLRKHSQPSNVDC